MARFVVLEHDWQGVHWDLMLEDGSALQTWALAQPPSVSGPIAARRLSDHRLAYLDYEGPVSGDRGHVVRWDAGTFRFLLQETDRITIALDGDRLRGDYCLVREEERWRFQPSDDSA